MTNYIRELESIVDSTSEKLAGLSEETAQWRPRKDGWSIKEVLGHLIDSASNNHQRFVRARWKDNLIFEGYDQDAWISAQDYQNAPLSDLRELWRLFNRHIARVMAATPEEIRMKPHSLHNLHEIAWETLPRENPATLDYFMRDYVGHLKHHLAQIDSLLKEARGNE